jgi:hypothetical protein
MSALFRDQVLPNDELGGLRLARLLDTYPAAKSLSRSPANTTHECRNFPAASRDRLVAGSVDGACNPVQSICRAVVDYARGSSRGGSARGAEFHDTAHNDLWGCGP